MELHGGDIRSSLPLSKFQRFASKTTHKNGIVSILKQERDTFDKNIDRKIIIST